MALTHICGFEMGSLNEVYKRTNSNVSLVTSPVKSGFYAVRVNPQADNNTNFEIKQANYTVPSRAIIWSIKCYIRVAQFPNTNQEMQLIHRGSETRVILTLMPSGKLKVAEFLSNENVSASKYGPESTNALALNTWYAIELDVGYNNNQDSRVFVDGVEWASRTGSGITFDPVTSMSPQVWFGTSGAGSTFTPTADVYYDDILLYNTALYPGVATPSPTPGWTTHMSLPTADFNRGSWVAGAGGTTNLWEAINNVPPLGSATQTDLINIETNVANAVYEGTFQSYSAAGVPADHTILGVIPVVNDAQDTTTGSPKAGWTSLSSNPVGINASSDSANLLHFGLPNGLTGTTVANPEGTHPSGWGTHFGDYVDSPTVVRADPIRAKVGNSNQTRLVLVDFFGIAIASEPPPASATKSASDTTSVGVTEGPASVSPVADAPEAKSASDAPTVSTTDTVTAITSSLTRTDNPTTTLSETSNKHVTTPDTTSIGVTEGASQITSVTTPSDTASVTVTDALSSLVLVNVSDSPTMGLAEIAESISTLSRSDTTTFSATENVPTQLITIDNRADTTSLGVTDTTTQSQITSSQSDDPTITLAETTQSSSTLAGADTPTIQLGEDATNQLSSSVADLTNLGVSEGVPTPFVYIDNRTDPVSVVVTDTSQNQLSSAPSDSPTLELVDSSVSSSTFERADSQTLQVDETVTSALSSTRTDSPTISLDEVTSDELTTAVSDTLSVVVIDTSADEAQFPASDTVTASITDGSQLVADSTDKGGVDSIYLSVVETEISQLTSSISDNPTILVVDDQDSLLDLSGQDTPRVSITETRASQLSSTVSDAPTVEVNDLVTQKNPRVTDDPSISTPETTSNLLNSSVTDTPRVQLGESRVTQSSSEVSDTPTIQATDAKALSVTTSGTDDPTVGIVDEVVASAMALQRPDTISISAQDLVQQLSVVVSRSDTPTLSLIEQVASMDLVIVATDDPRLAITEALQMGLALTAEDSPTVSVMDVVFRAALELTRTDSVNFTLQDQIALNNITVQVSDAIDLDFDEVQASSLTLTGNDPIAVDLLEQLDRVIDVAVTDSILIFVTESAEHEIAAVAITILKNPLTTKVVGDPSLTLVVLRPKTEVTKEDDSRSVRLLGSGVQEAHVIGGKSEVNPV